MDPAAVLKMLKASPVRIAALTRGLTNEQLQCKPSAEAWSVNEVLAHLRACADVWGAGILAMLNQDRPAMRYVSPRTWIRKTDYTEQGFAVSFRAFRSQRDDLLQVLRPLSVEDWLRTATVRRSSGVREETVLIYAQRLAQHEAGHCEQMERILNRAT
jgi:hypothetical protein